MLKKAFIVSGLLLFALPPLAMAQTTCPNITRNLSYGSRGNDVVALQSFLVAQNMLASDSATGYFGKLTQSAVQVWQRNNSIVSSGTPTTSGFGAVGPKTRKALANCSTALSTKNINTKILTLDDQASPQTEITDHSYSFGVGPKDASCPSPLLPESTLFRVAEKVGLAKDVGGQWSATFKEYSSVVRNPFDGPPGSLCVWEIDAWKFDYDTFLPLGVVLLPDSAVSVYTNTKMSCVQVDSGTAQFNLPFTFCAPESLAVAWPILKNDSPLISGVPKFPQSGPQNGTGELVVSPPSGSAPLTVSVLFPKEWQDLADRLCRSRDTSSSSRGLGTYSDERTLSIDWGDGNKTSSLGETRPCPTHTYATPGSYAIQAVFGAFTNAPPEISDSYNKRQIWVGNGGVVVLAPTP